MHNQLQSFKKFEPIHWPWPVRLSVIFTIILALLLAWQDWLHNILNTYGYVAHGYSFHWEPGLLMLQVTSNALIGLSYVAISATLLYFVVKTRHDVPFQWIFVAFGIFIVACGTTHVFEIVTLWIPVYWLSGAIKAINAVASMTTAIALLPSIPRIRAVIASAKQADENKRQLAIAHQELEVMYQKLEGSLHRSERRYDDLIESLPLIVWKANADGMTDYRNRHWFEYTGLTPEQVTNEPTVPYIYPEDRQRILDLWQNVVTSGEPYESEYRFQHHSGTFRWQLGRAIPIKDEDGQLLYWLGTATDIEELKHSQQELQESEARKDAFLSMASHELKTPITSISGYTQILQAIFAKEDRPQVVQYLTKMEKQIDKLVKLISDLLDVSKIQTGNFVFQQEEIEVCAFAHGVVETMQEISPQHTISLTCAEQAEEAKIAGDRDRLEQVIQNLLTNAMKFSPQSAEVDVLVEVRQQQVVFSVRDYGIGIPKAHHEKIFERYYRVFDERDKKFPGLGIGLSIVAGIVEKHGGTCWVESEEGRGSTFSFALPLLL